MNPFNPRSSQNPSAIRQLHIWPALLFTPGPTRLFRSPSCPSKRTAPFSLARRAMTSETLRNKGFIDCTRGVSREQRAINRRNKLESSLISGRSDRPKRPREDIKGLNRALEKLRQREAFEAEWAAAEDRQCAVEEQLFYKLPDPVISDSIYEEKSFGLPVSIGEEFYRPTVKDAKDLSSIVVSFALFDGDKMLFACSGIPLPYGKTLLQLTRFVTSARLVQEFNANRNKDDKLRIEVCLPNKNIINGFLGLYDRDIAIVTCIGLQNVNHVHLDHKATLVNTNDHILAFGRAFKVGSLMAACGSLDGECPKTWVCDSQDLTETVLGGPLIQDGRFLGMIHDLHCDENVQCALFIPQEILCEHLEHFQILDPKELHFREYALPEGVFSIVPSGFIKTIRRLKSNGYPLPPPLVLEFNGRLLNCFEDYFGELRAWKGYPFGAPPGDPFEYIWDRLKKRVVTNISRRVVSLASFDGHERSFACTGLLIKWHCSARHTVILTSASLVRSRYNEEDINNNLTIEVFLPPNQRGRGTLELYDLNYNIAVVSVEKNFHSIRPEGILNKVQKSPEDVIAIGRDVEDGLLMASSGVVKPDMNSKLDYCKDLEVSTCKINKAGIGGPLITFGGSFIGMNFYDGSKETPFLPMSVILKSLREVINLPLPSESGNNPKHINDAAQSTTKNRWPVPKPYWYHGALDVDRYYIPMLPGRVLQ